MNCPLCGYEFKVETMACHDGCPMGSRCNLICCPNCGYQVVDESKSWFSNFLHDMFPFLKKTKPPQRKQKRDSKGELLIPLTHVAVGKMVEVSDMDELTSHRLTKLSVFGFVPGSQVEVLQHRPSPIIRIDQTELTLSKEILDQIWVYV
ncbi:MAG: hypothetical protein B6242_01150 [Anaerolineaceae bacterium 4572_78]|nr:MAG: hypothetical protein B6242_01150 [Anaerolineaceae bacterium 4572_78]